MTRPAAPKDDAQYSTIKTECRTAIRRYKAYKKIPYDSFQVWACSEKKGAYLLARRILRIIKNNKT